MKPVFVKVEGTLQVYRVEADRLVHVVNPTHLTLLNQEGIVKFVKSTDTILDMLTVYPLGVPEKLREPV